MKDKSRKNQRWARLFVITQLQITVLYSQPVHAGKIEANCGANHCVYIPSVAAPQYVSIRRLENVCFDRRFGGDLLVVTGELVNLSNIALTNITINVGITSSNAAVLTTTIALHPSFSIVSPSQAAPFSAEFSADPFLCGPTWVGSANLIGLSFSNDANFISLPTEVVTRSLASPNADYCAELVTIVTNTYKSAASNITIATTVAGFIFLDQLPTLPPSASASFSHTTIAPGEPRFCSAVGLGPVTYVRATLNP